MCRFNCSTLHYVSFVSYYGFIDHNLYVPDNHSQGHWAFLNIQILFQKAAREPRKNSNKVPDSLRILNINKIWNFNLN